MSSRRRRWPYGAGDTAGTGHNVADESNADPGGGKADPATVFAALAEIIYRGSDAREMYAAICVAATLSIRGCDHASLLVREGDHYVTVGASDRIAQAVDELERRAGDGPCIDAIEEETPQIDTDLTSPSLWPRLASVLVEETPVRGAMGFRLLVDKRKGAALNLFSDSPNLFDAESAGRAAVLAAFASVAINAVAKGEDASTLRRGLLSNREIGKAVGMLMLLHELTEDQAFDLLRRHSQDLNVKLAEVARAVIENRGQLPSNDENQPLTSR